MRILLIALTIFLTLPSIVFGQELHNDFQGNYRAEVREVVSEEMQEIPGTGTEHLVQTITADVLEGPLRGSTITIENDYLVLEAGDRFYFNHNIYIDGRESYGITGIDRTRSLMTLGIIFIAAVVLFGGWQGLRSLIALIGSFVAIFYILLPGLLNGWNPLVASFLVAAGILFAAIFFTHGFNRESAVAYGGTMIAVLITSILAIVAVSGSNLSGFSTDESIYLNFNTGGALDFTALLIGAIIIGVLGVLDDIAVTQAAVVTELFNSNPDLSRKDVYKRALRVGREHVGALVNTLVLAYAGASLPLLMYLYMAPSDIGALINSEIIAVEIVRAIVGSIGLILTVPIVTLLAVIYLKGYESKHGHSHSHGHM